MRFDLYLHRGFSIGDLIYATHVARHRLSSLDDPSAPVIPKATKKPTAKIADPLDIAARYFVYKLYVPGRALTESWQPLSTVGEAAATVHRAVEGGWVTLRDVGQGKNKERYAALTDEGRVLARKTLR